MHLVHPMLFVLAVPVTIASVGSLGFLLAVAFVRYRSAWALGNALEYPVWLICGFLVPLTLLPGWVTPISWSLAPTFGVRAIREAALGGAPAGDLLACAALGLAYFTLGVLLSDRVLRAARKSRVRESAVSSNIVFGLLLVLCGVNVPLHELPGWMEVIGRGLPLTHGIQAARELTDGAGLSDVVGLVGTEALIGLVWGVLGCTMLRLLGFEARRRATLETA